MPTNKNAQLRYQILDRCFSDFHRKYEIKDLLDKVNDALKDLYGTEVSIRQIRDDIKYMRDRVTYNAPIKAYPYDGKKCYYRYEDEDFLTPIISVDKRTLTHWRVLSIECGNKRLSIYPDGGFINEWNIGRQPNGEFFEVSTITTIRKYKSSEIKR